MVAVLLVAASSPYVWLLNGRLRNMFVTHASRMQIISHLQYTVVAVFVWLISSIEYVDDDIASDYRHNQILWQIVLWTYA